MSNQIAVNGKVSAEMLNHPEVLSTFIKNEGMYRLEKIPIPGRCYRFDTKISFGYKNEDFDRNLMTFVITQKFYRKPRFIDYARDNSIERQYYQGRRKKARYIYKRRQHGVLKVVQG